MCKRDLRQGGGIGTVRSQVRLIHAWPETLLVFQILMYQFPGIVMVDANSIQVIKREFYALLQKDVRSRLF